MLLLIQILIVLSVAGAAVGQARGWSFLERARLSPLKLLVCFACAHIGFMIFLWFNHIGFPLNLDLMEGTILQHVRQALHGRPIYPAPTPEYSPLAYNPLYYIVAVPFAWLLGDSLATLRAVSILGMATIGVVTFVVIKRRTGSTAWGFIGIGLYAAAYRMMDAYLDSAHSDSWFIASAMLGTLLLDRQRSVWRNCAGLLLLSASFWFKQHGALFAIGGLLYLLPLAGTKRALAYCAVVLVAGPLAYLVAGPTLFGTHFHYFTWTVPSQWSEFTRYTIYRYLGFISRNYIILAIPAFLLLFRKIRQGWRKLDAWDIQFLFALLSGLMGCLDPGSSDNVFIAMGIWLIVLGTSALKEVGTRFVTFGPYQVEYALLACVFALMIYDPRPVIVSPRAGENFDEFLSFLHEIPGPVYAPSLGQLQRGYTFYPSTHWASLDDMIRGPAKVIRDHPNTRAVLAPLLGGGSHQYILLNYPLSGETLLAFLEDYYVLERDLGDRFEPLRVLPKRWDHGWPRYLYKFKPPTGLH